MTGELFAIIAPVFITAAIGYGWMRLGRPFDAEFVTNVVVTPATPCLVGVQPNRVGRGQVLVLGPGLHAATLFAGAEGIAKIVEDVHPQARGETGLQPVLADARAYLVDRSILAAGNLQQGVPHGLFQADAGSLSPHTNVPDNQRTHNI